MSASTGKRPKAPVTVARPVLSKEIEDKLISAKVNLYTEQPFFAQIAQHFAAIGSNVLETAGVTAAKKLYLNPTFADKCNIKDLTFIIAHEVMHIVNATFAREPEGADHTFWNVATDIVINYILCNRENGASMIPLREEVAGKILFGGEWVKYDGWVSEDVYYDLLKNHSATCPNCGKQQHNDNSQGQEEQDGGGSGGDGDQQADSGGGDSSEQRLGSNTSGANGNCKCFDGYWFDGTGDAVGNPNAEGRMDEEEMQEWKERIAAAAEEARQAGKLPGMLDQFCTNLLQPRKNWKRKLRLATARALKKRYDWKKISRRTAGRVRTPGRSPYLPEAVLYMDTSGSMSDDDLRAAINEMGGILKLSGGKGTLILGDYEVYYVGEVTPNSLTDLPVQRGGTNFIPVFEAIRERGIKPAIFIGFSDLEGPFVDQRVGKLRLLGVG